MLNIYMYTRGTASGHLARINAVFKGFKRSRIACRFFACAPRSKYTELLESGITLCKKDEFPAHIDIFICDWGADDYVARLPFNVATTWIGLRRLGKMRKTFPTHFHVIAVEPSVKGDVLIWPIISTWADELVSRDAMCKILGVDENVEVALVCENGAYAKHIDTVFDSPLPTHLTTIRVSNSPHATEKRDLSYYPVAQLFDAVDYLVLGGGYNSVHEALSYADVNKTTFIHVGGDDQEQRMNKQQSWEKGRESQAHSLAQYIADYHYRQF